MRPRAHLIGRYLGDGYTVVERHLKPGPWQWTGCTGTGFITPCSNSVTRYWDAPRCTLAEALVDP